MLNSLVYFSTEKVPFDRESLRRLEAFAAEKNFLYGVTGYLFYDRGQFVQYIEGEPDRLDSLLANLQHDSRHEVHKIHQKSDIQERLFPNWRMKLVLSESVISVEHLLMDHLSWTNALRSNVSYNEDIVWRMVNRLSQLQLQIG